MEEYHCSLKTGITRTIDFEKKRLALFGVTCGIKCGNGCLYCYMSSLLRMHPVFAQIGKNPFASGYAIVDPDTPNRVARDACRKRHRGMVQLCTFGDAWAQEAVQYDIGRRCLEAILSQPDWTVRILTKNAVVAKDFDVIERHSDRILFGMSITSTPDKASQTAIIEPNASSISERTAVMKKAHKCGVRTYAMLCPLLPGIADSPDQVEQLVKSAVEYGAQEIFAEPVNTRGPGLRITQETLANYGYKDEAAAIKSIRNQKGWSRYTTRLICNVQRSVRKLSDISRLRFLLYPSRLTEKDAARITRDDAGIVWLGKD
jgi:DNA repair photolyase